MRKQAGQVGGQDRLTRRKRRKAGGRKADQETIVAALALAATHGDKEAARAFRLSTRTLQRYKKAAAADPDGELARAVHAARARALRMVDDLLTQTWEAILHRLQDLLPTATMAEVNDAAKTVGELRLTREALGVEELPHDDDSDGVHRQGATAPEAARRGEKSEGSPKQGSGVLQN